VAKKDKNTERSERRERMERLQREAQRAERRRTMTVVVVCVVIALVIVSLTGWKLYQDNLADDELAGKALSDIGVGADAAGCQDVVTKPAEGSSEHIDPPTPIPYADAPPAFGPHRPQPADFARKFYTVEDRPEVAELVHNLEHGYTILWYDQSVADDAAQLQTVEDLAGKFDVGAVEDIDDQAEYNANKFVAAPWTNADGPFPDDKNVVLTRWTADPVNPSEQSSQKGVRQPCSAVSGAVISSFMQTYPARSSPEPNGA